MKIEKSHEGVTLLLEKDELKWLRRALERASFIDTPLEEQQQILDFATKALEQLDRV